MVAKLGALVKTIKDEDFILTRKKFRDSWRFVTQKSAYPYEALGKS